MEGKKLTKNYFGNCAYCNDLVQPTFNLKKVICKDGQTRFYRVVEEVYCKTCDLKTVLTKPVFDVQISEQTYNSMLNLPEKSDRFYFTKAYRVIVTGPTSFGDYEKLCECLDKCLSRKREQNTPIEIVSGRAPGTELMGERYASEHGHDLIYFPGFPKDEEKEYLRIRNMCIYADAVVSFWDNAAEAGWLLPKAKEKGLAIRSFKI